MILALPQTLQQKTNRLRSSLTMERRGWVAALAIGCAIAYGLGNHNYEASQGEIRDISHQAKIAKKEAVAAKSAVVVVLKHDDCVTRKADVATAVANDPNGNTSAIPYCPPPPKVPAIVSPGLKGSLDVKSN